MDCSPSGSSVSGVLQARIPGWVAIPSSRGSSWPRDRNCISCDSCIAGGFFIAEPPGKHFQGMSQSRAISWIFPACCHFCSLLIICMTASSSGQGASVWLLYSPGQEHGRFSVNIRCCSQPPHPSPPAPARAPLGPGLQTQFKASLTLGLPWFLQRTSVSFLHCSVLGCLHLATWLLYDPLNLFL